MHHAVVEGEGGVANAALLVFDAAPDPEPLPPQPWEPAPAPGRAEEVRLALADQRRRIAGCRAASPQPAPGAAGLEAAVRALRAYAREIEGRRSLPRFRQPIDAHATAFAVAPAAHLEAVRAAAGEGTTFNDVFVAGVAGGIRRWQERAGLEAADLTAAIPVSLGRAEGDAPSEFTEMPSIMLVSLPATEADAGERLRLVRAATARGKVVARDLAVVAKTISALPAGLYRRAAARFYDRAPDFYLDQHPGAGHGPLRARPPGLLRLHHGPHPQPAADGGALVRRPPHGRDRLRPRPNPRTRPPRPLDRGGVRGARRYRYRSRGRPRIRSAITFLTTSVVPPSIELARARKRR